MSAVLDAVNPLERVRLSGELAGKVKELAGVDGALQRIGIAGRIAVILRALGAVVPETKPVASIGAEFPLAEARSSYSGISHSGTARGNGDAADYEQTISMAVAEAAPLAETEAQRAAMVAEEGAFRSEYLAQYRQLMGVRAATYSGHVAGRSGLNSKQANARNSALDNAMTRFYAWVEGQRGRIKGAVLRARSADQLAAAQAVKQAELDAEDAKRAEKNQKSVAFMVKLLTFKSGDSIELGSSIIKKVSKDRDGNPSKLTFVYADGSVPFDDKIDILRVLYRGDKDALRRDAEAAKAMLAGSAPEPAPEPTPEPVPEPVPVPVPAHPDNGRAAAGGTVGLNGEFYKGGSFLPRTTLPKQGSAPGSTTSGRGWLIEPGVFDHPPMPGARSIFSSYSEFLNVADGVATVREKPGAAIEHYVDPDVAEGRAFLRAAAEAYSAGMRWYMPGQIQPQPEHYEVPAPTLVEHVTKGGKGKTIRGIVRTDLSYAEAKAIDEYTFKKDGGYFIREKHLEGFAEPDKEVRPPAATKPEPTADEVAQADADRLADAQLKESKKRTEIATKLRASGISTMEKAEEELGQDRNTNTARRARMASSITQRHEAARAIGITMQNLANAIEAGDATHLSGITSRAAVETLQGLLRQGMYETDRKLTYSEQERSKGRAPTAEDASNATFPFPKWGTAGTSEARILEAIKGKRGGPELAKTIRFTPGPDAANFSALKTIVGEKEAKSLIGWWNLEQLAKVERLRRAGITNDRELREALGEYLEFRSGARAEDPIKVAERAIIGQKVGIDFFPTPAATAVRMAQIARISKGDRVLEPSAGNGNLADAAKAAGAEVEVVEMSSQLRDILTAKGYTIVAHDFESFTPDEKYDAILMNPPFSDRKDSLHIQRAFGMLKSGGRLVAIAGEGVFIGSDARATQFMRWLESVGAEVESLDQGTFKDKSLLATTGANARLITIEK